MAIFSLFLVIKPPFSQFPILKQTKCQYDGTNSTLFLQYGHMIFYRRMAWFDRGCAFLLLKYAFCSFYNITVVILVLSLLPISFIILTYLSRKIKSYCWFHQIIEPFRFSMLVTDDAIVNACQLVNIRSEDLELCAGINDMSVSFYQNYRSNSRLAVRAYLIS